MLNIIAITQHLNIRLLQGRRVLRFVLFLLATAISATQTVAAQERMQIADVTLLIGKVQAVSSDGETRRLRQGDAVYIGDVITTRSNGHAHFHFVDDARLSLRPNSRLTLHTYAFNPAAPTQSRIRFDLETGGVRAVSGQGAESARDNYRFNTPLAAIGVRGTDFTVTADANRVRAFVNQGAIAMAPISANCVAESLGPCQGAIELRGGSQEILEIGRSEQSLRRLQLTLDDTLGSQRVNGQFQSDDSSTQSSVERRENERGESEPDAAPPTTSDENNQQGAAGNTPEWQEGNERPLSPDDLLLTPGTEKQALPPAGERQLVWGHWGDAANRPSYMLPYEQAAQGRVARVRTQDLVLLRRESDTASLNTQHLGAVAFQLDSAAVTLHQPQGQRSDMNVTAGALNIDFSKQRFVTALDLDHADTGALRFSMQGDVKDGGILIGSSPEGSIVGAGSLDGAEAAYYFQHLIEQGFIEGTTLWGAQ